jgi:hypothetical protein
LPAGTVRVVDRGSVAAPALKIAGRQVSFTIPNDGLRHVVAKQFFVTTKASSALHLRVTFDKVLIRRAMDPGCVPKFPPGCGTPETTRDDQVTSGPTGEWVFYSDVGGVWSLWKQPLVWHVRDGQTIRPRTSFELYAPRGRPLRVLVWPHECDWASLARGGGGALYPCPKQSEVGNRGGDDVPGAVAVQFRSPAAALGTHALNSSNVGSTCPASNTHGCYRVTFTVRRVR